ncbi:MAG: phage protein Gp36 family protein, partial [Waterburya sp.]
DQETAELCSLDDDAELTAVRLRIQQSIEHADAEINAILGGRYNMPPNVTVPLLNWASLIIARENLHKNARPETVDDDYARVIRRLERIADGKEVLIDESGNRLPPIGTGNTDDKLLVHTSANYTKNMKATVPNFGFAERPDFYSERERWI